MWRLKIHGFLIACSPEVVFCPMDMEALFRLLFIRSGAGLFGCGGVVSFLCSPCMRSYEVFLMGSVLDYYSYFSSQSSSVVPVHSPKMESACSRREGTEMRRWLCV